MPEGDGLETFWKAGEGDHSMISIRPCTFDPSIENWKVNNQSGMFLLAVPLLYAR
jgi:hypothetical protein